MLFWIVIILLVVLLIAAVPVYPHSRGWGYSPAGIVLAILAVLLLLWLLGIIDFNEDAVDDAAFLSQLVLYLR